MILDVAAGILLALVIVAALAILLSSWENNPDGGYGWWFIGGVLAVLAFVVSRVLHWL